MSLGRQLLRNIVSSWMSYGVRLAVGFFFVPYIAASLGGEKYGLWTILFQTVNYFTLLDFGLERAVIRFVGKFSGERDSRSVSRVLSTATVIYAILALLIALGTYLVARFFFGLFHVDDPFLLHEARSAFRILGLFLMVRFILNGFTQTLVGLQRTDVYNALDIFEELVRIGTLVYLLANGYHFPALAAGILGASVLRQLGVLIWLRVRHPEISFRFGLFDRERARELFQFSKISFGITLGWLVVFGSDSILLGLMAAPLAAGLYAPATQLMLYLRHIVNAIGTPFAPAVSQLEAEANLRAVARAFLKGTRYVSFLSFFVCAGVIVFATPFVHLWLPAQFMETARVMMVLAVGAAFFLPQILGNAVLFGMGRHKYLLWTLAAEAGLKLALAIPLTLRYGAVGMAVATAIPQILLYTAVYPVIVSRQLGLSAREVIRTLVRNALVALMVTLPIGFAVKLLISPDTWPLLILDIGVVTAVAGFVALRYVVEPDDKTRFLTAFR